MLCLREKALVSSFFLFFDVGGLPFLCSYPDVFGALFSFTMVRVCFSFYPSFSIQPTYSLVHPFHPSRIKAKHQER
ncbi:hypothetical protein GGI42DRAFT_330545 [Trichoderma sp. SZMC 28013]